MKDRPREHVRRAQALLENGGALNEIAERISRVMSETSTIAASLAEVMRALERDGVPELGAGEVVEAVLQCPDRYRLLNTMRGAWTAGNLCRSPGSYGKVLAEQYITPDPWIVLLDDRDPYRDARGDPLVRSTRQTLVCLARGLDEKSPAAVNRWFRLLREHRRLRERRRAHGLRFN